MTDAPVQVGPAPPLRAGPRDDNACGVSLAPALVACAREEMLVERVLVVDDSGIYRSVTCKTLEEWGYEPIPAEGADEALRILRAPNPPRLVLLDWMMPGVSGIELCRHIKGADDLPFIYVILLTSKTETEDVVAGLDAGADDFVSKPFETAELHSRVRAGFRVLHYQQALADRTEQVRSLLVSMPGVVMIKDGAGRLIEANETCVELFGLARTEWQGQDAAALGRVLGVKGESLAAWERSDAAAWEGGGILREEIALTVGGGRRLVFDVTKDALRDASGERKALIVVGHDVTVRKELEEELLHDASTDPLTGLFNRRGMEKRFEPALQYARRFEHPLSLCLCDVDRFKGVNDTYGHHAGDEVLKKLADIMRSELREVDVACRHGGDEFAILLPGAAAEDSAACMERIRRRLESEVFDGGEAGAFHVSGTFGIADTVAAEATREGLAEAADQALYAAKERGRNQVSLYASESPPLSLA